MELEIDVLLKMHGFLLKIQINLDQVATGYFQDLWKTLQSTFSENFIVIRLNPGFLRLFECGTRNQCFNTNGRFCFKNPHILLRASNNVIFPEPIEPISDRDFRKFYSNRTRL